MRLLGYFVTKFSIFDTFLTFSDDPSLISINKDDNIFNIFNKIMSSPWGEYKYRQGK